MQYSRYAVRENRPKRDLNFFSVEDVEDRLCLLFKKSVILSCMEQIKTSKVIDFYNDTTLIHR